MIHGLRNLKLQEKKYSSSESLTPVLRIHAKEIFSSKYFIEGIKIILIQRILPIRLIGKTECTGLTLLSKTNRNSRLWKRGLKLWNDIFCSFSYQSLDRFSFGKASLEEKFYCTFRHASFTVEIARPAQFFSLSFFLLWRKTLQVLFDYPNK